MKNLTRWNGVLVLFSALAVSAVLASPSWAKDKEPNREPAAYGSSASDNGSEKYYVGILGGAAFLTSGGSVTNGVFGGHAGMKLTPEINVGFYGTYQQQSVLNTAVGVNTTNRTTNLVFLMAEAQYYLIPNELLYIGAKAGLAMTIVTGTQTISGFTTSLNSNTSSFGFGGSIGYMKKLSSSFSAGLEGSFLGVAQTGSMTGMFDITASINFHF
ncbi:porin family protein [bacterium]|nr:porin family protein [bacterium]